VTVACNGMILCLATTPGNAMKLPRRTFLQLAAGAAALPAISRIASAQAWPTRPVRIIVPFQPGGSTDIFARLAAQKLTEHFGKQFYVENIAGATGNVGTAQAARAAPDGHTLLIAFSSYVVSPTLFAKLPFDPDKDLAAVTLAVAAPNVVTVNPSLPARNLKELVGLIKSNPGKYTYTSGGVGTQAHLLAELLRLSQGLDIVHVPFNGAAPAIASAVAGHTPIAWSTIASAAQPLEAGQLRALAVASKTRSQLLSDVPTTAEAGYPDIQGDSWVGLLAPAGTPNEIVGAVQREIARIIALPEVKERLPTLGFEAVGSTPEEFASRIKIETETWGKVIRAATMRSTGRGGEWTWHTRKQRHLMHALRKQQVIVRDGRGVRGRYRPISLL
jgi:tripartite-type tricarboxylate transporter receptor subunit TctC